MKRAMFLSLLAWMVMANGSDESIALLGERSLEIGRMPAQESYVVAGAMFRGVNRNSTGAKRPSLFQSAFEGQCKRRAAGFTKLVVPVADLYGVDWRLVTAIVAAESNFDPCATSPRGAAGLMQLTPETARKYRLEVHELYDPAKNIRAGVQHLKKLSTKYNGDLEMTLAAYNAGEGVVDKYAGIPPYRETRRYVEKVMNYHTDLILAAPDPDSSTDIKVFRSPQ